MDIATTVLVLEGTSALVGTAVAIREWFRQIATASNLDPNLAAAINSLPTNAGADEILSVLKLFYAARGGDAVVTAGHVGGGNVHLEHVVVEGGSGAGGGGNAIISGGDGGPLGNGGSVNVVGGTIKGGDAM